MLLTLTITPAEQTELRHALVDKAVELRGRAKRSTDPVFAAMVMRHADAVDALLMKVLDAEIAETPMG